MPNASDWRASLEAGIRRQMPDVEAVEFDDDGEHVLLLTEGRWVRYRLSPEAEQFLHGEFPEGGEFNLLATRAS